MQAIIGPKTRLEFREYFVGKTLREISEAFDAAGVRCDLDFQPQISGQRRSLVEQYYHTVNWSAWSSVMPIVRLFESELLGLFEPPPVGFAWNPAPEKERLAGLKAIGDRLLHFLKQDGFEWTNGGLHRSAEPFGLDTLSEQSVHIDGNHLSKQIQRLTAAVELDPDLAIGTAKELIESVCKTILFERGMKVEGTPDIPTLTKALLKELSLVPEGIHDERRGAETIKGILRSLGTIGNDIAQLRGMYGTGHGKDARTGSLTTRHAKLAVGAATTFSTFLFETHKASQKEKKNGD